MHTPHDPRTFRRALIVCTVIPALALGFAFLHHALGEPFGPAWASELWWVAKAAAAFLVFGSPAAATLRRVLAPSIPLAALDLSDHGRAIDPASSHAALERSGDDTRRIPTASFAIIKQLPREDSDDDESR